MEFEEANDSPASSANTTVLSKYCSKCLLWAGRCAGCSEHSDSQDRLCLRLPSAVKEPWESEKLGRETGNKDFLYSV